MHTHLHTRTTLITLTHPPPFSSLYDEDDPTLPAYDPSTQGVWVYPTNYPVREYQFNIVRACLLKNTLVSLPTGLGKTFIAAVVMYNYYKCVLCITHMLYHVYVSSLMRVLQVVSDWDSGVYGTHQTAGSATD